MAPNIEPNYCDLKEFSHNLASKNYNSAITKYIITLDLPKNVEQMYSDIWFPDLLDSEKWLSSLFSIRLNWNIREHTIKILLRKPHHAFKWGSRSRKSYRPVTCHPVKAKIGKSARAHFHVSYVPKYLRLFSPPLSDVSAQLMRGEWDPNRLQYKSSTSPLVTIICSIFTLIMHSERQTDTVVASHSGKWETLYISGDNR